MWKEIFISFYEFVPAAQFSAVVSVCRVDSVRGLSLVVHFLSRKMTTEDFDIIADAIEQEEYKNSTWHNDPPSLARSERLCVNLHKREADDTLETTKFAIENVIALMVGDNFSHKMSIRQHWETDFVRFLLGFTTGREEGGFQSMCKGQTRLLSVENSVTKLMGYSLSSVLKYDSTFSNKMDDRGTLPLNTVFDNLGNRVNPLSLFESYINGSVDQKFFIDVYLHDKWNPEETSMAWSIYIGCNPDHSTGVMIPSRVTHTN